MPEDTQVFAAHYTSDNQLKAVKSIDIAAATGVRRIKTTTELGVGEGDSLKILFWSNTMSPFSAPEIYSER